MVKYLGTPISYARLKWGWKEKRLDQEEVYE